MFDPQSMQHTKTLIGNTELVKLDKFLVRTSHSNQGQYQWEKGQTKRIISNYVKRNYCHTRSVVHKGITGGL